MIDILIDCDGVLANFHEMAITAIKDQFDIDVKCDGENWDYFKYPEVEPISNKLWNYILETPGIIRNLKKYDYTDDLIYKLRQIGNVICTTSIPRSKYYPGERFSWLIEELGFDRKDIILGFQKHRIKGDVFIDDKPANVISWSKAWPGVPVLWSSPGWYVNSTETNHIFKTGNVDELINHLKNMKVI